MKNLIFFIAIPLVAAAKGTPEQTGQFRTTIKTTGPTESLAIPRQERMVTHFSSINVTDGIKLYLQHGTQEHVAVETSSTYLSDKIKTVVEDGVLRIYFDASDDPTWKGLVNSKEEFKVYATIDDLQKLQASKGAEVALTNDFSISNDANVSLASGAALSGKLEAKSLTITMRGGSVARIAGTIGQLSVQVTEGSRFQSAQLKADFCTAYASSASQIKVCVNKALEAKSVNEAVISYAGKGELKKSTSEMGGKILRI